MKKYITEQQLKEIQDLGYKGGNSIGDLIEFLGDKWDLEVDISNSAAPEVILPKNNDLCDALWQAVKKRLNTK